MTIEELKQMLKSTQAEHDRLSKQYQQGSAYYYNDADITKTGAAAIAEVNAYLSQLGKNPLKSANNKIPTNWHRILTDQKIGYLFTYPPQFDTDRKEGKKTDTLVDKISKCLGDCYEKVIKQIATDASNGGVGWLAYWYKKELFSVDKDFHYYFVNPTQIRAVYDSTSMIPKLSAIVYSYITYDKQQKPVTNYDVWSDRDVTYFTQAEHSDVVQGKTAAHTYGEIPFIPFKNNDRCVDDLKMYKALIDAIDKLISGFANDIDDIQEIIWVIKNYAGETQAFDYDKDGNEIQKEVNLLQEIKAKKLLNVDEKGGVDTLRGEIPHEARSKFLEILINQLFISAMAVNPNPDKVGQASGVYIKFLYSLLELKAGLMETEFRPSLNQFVRAILKYLSADTKIKIEQKWTRNRPTNDVEIVDMIAKTSNTVLSDETKTKEHPLTENWQTERERIEEEGTLLAKNLLDDVGGDGE